MDPYAGSEPSTDFTKAILQTFPEFLLIMTHRVTDSKPIPIILIKTVKLLQLSIS